ncbi:hypothetical protein SYNPS1DRAFT_28285 [Syncephalis pseudoplumigaleata]|uniref:Cytochrome b561 domain-containing protein n=1 Tax=Syncephalis pseudoplumigaleata TaxID=1712513 RepID=A0A4V1J1R7_9FUNG|nr:hypothetical protein SYNPS1DRAFT_28285 [Syncephalis pseudoplumigaleata]|eukprot:RKP25999.1 hypothetical protein SYNPS1DRAFT_28285 [Syncephalis pseudoplumigaleata]
MQLAWLLIAPVAMLIGVQPLRRHLFPSDHSSSVRHTRAHRWTMIAVFVMATAGSSIGMFVLHRGPAKSLHGIVGIVVYALLCLLATLGILRAHGVKPTGKRNVVQRALNPHKHMITAIHRHLGLLVWTLASINVMLGLLKIHAHYAHLTVIGTYIVLWFGVLIYQLYFKRSLISMLQQKQTPTPPIVQPAIAANNNNNNNNNNDLHKLSNIDLNEKMEEIGVAEPV